MERHENSRSDGRTELYGMRASFSMRVPAKVLPGAMSSILSSPACAARTHPPAGPLDQLSYRRSRVSGPRRLSTRSSSPIRRSIKGKFVNSPPAPSSTPSAMRSLSAAPEPAKPICASPWPRRSSAPAPGGASLTWSTWSISWSRKRFRSNWPTVRKTAASRSYRHRRTRLPAVQSIRRPVAVPPDKQALRTRHC